MCWPIIFYRRNRAAWNRKGSAMWNRNPTSFPMLMLIGIIFMIKISFTFYNKIPQETERL